MEGFFRQVRKDRVIQIFSVLFIAAHIPYLLPGATAENMEHYSWIMTAAFLQPFTIVCLWPRRSNVYSNDERLFWKMLSFAFFLWWSISIINLMWWDVWTAWTDITTDSMFVGYYMSWFIALSFVPHVQGRHHPERSDRWLFGAGAGLLALCLFLYFILIPSRVTPEFYDSWVPSLLFYAGLDIVLVLLLARLIGKASALRWKVLYGILAVTFLGYEALDLLEALNYIQRYYWAGAAASDILWSLPFIPLVVFARARSFEFPEPAIAPNLDGPLKEPSLAITSPIILVSFILPVLHISLDLAGLLNPAMRRAQITVVLASLVLFWVLAVLENLSLRQVTQKAKDQSAEYERLRIKQQVAEKAEQAKGQFLANVSHEIRTPMSGILGMSEILLRGELSSDQRHQAELVQSSARGLLGIIDDILEHSKLEAGELSFVRETFNLKEVVSQVLDLARIAGGEKNVAMNLELHDNIPPWLEGDSSRLRQVLLNLVANAVKFTPAGEIRIRLSLGGKTDSTATVRCEVIDSGIGINPSVLDQLFLPFSQGDDSTARKYGGSGLGLAISKQIIEAQSGKIGVFNNRNAGATFWFEVPYTIAAVKTEDPVREKATASAPKSGERILLAEDDMINQLVAVKQLETLGQVVDVAKNGNEVLEALKQRSYALVLMDCQMPELDGFQTTRLIREQGYTLSDLPIIALTANVFDEDRERCYEAGMNDFLAKPVSLESLRSALLKWLKLDSLVI